MAATRSGASGLAVLPFLIFGETGSLAAIFRAFAAGTPSMASLRLAGVSFWGGVRPWAGCFLVALFEAAVFFPRVGMGSG